MPGVVLGVVLRVMRRVIRTAIIVVYKATEGLRGYGRKAFGATVVRPSGVRTAFGG